MAYGEPLQNFSTFIYLGRVLTVGDDDWLAVVGSLEKARKRWGQLYRILSREGADPKVSGKFYKTVVQAVLMFEAETWVLTRGWSGPWTVSNTGSQGGSPGKRRGDGRMRSGNIRL